MTIQELVLSDLPRREKINYIYDNFTGKEYYEKRIEFYELEEKLKPAETPTMYAHYLDCLKSNMKAHYA